jgi:AcrR family transcriptional regulator
LDTALSLMAQRGVDGTSMRDLAAATGLNVASLYHYFPSKRELLVAVLDDRGYLDDLAEARPGTMHRESADALAELLDETLVSMLEVEDFIRLMMGEVMRGDDTAHAVGVEVFAATQASLEHWLRETEPALCEVPGAPAVARMLRATLIGLFFEHVAGVLDDQGDTAAAFRARAIEAAAVLRSAGAPQRVATPDAPDAADV